ncbi:hypothetical protein CMI45_00865 [Candidatus Pacearchaeota archaeon]|nr:hypothetical protein [Candidatus Pacearchaeota archaeon]
MIKRLGKSLINHFQEKEEKMVDKDTEKVREEARALLENFAKKLEKVDLGKEKEEKDMKESGFREEGEGKEANEDFKKRFLDNAPNVKGGKIVAEKKSW